ncbi:hypothetical protein TVAG_319700 [Trichomonas vaginalis G3]|uniref:Uncharacterized protein n=1 Tax=Trichomonas vaginalis (strain ATCC PRA-98 / G3) TaxID=412133 RepID=A2DQB8_TRIV3|nr:VPS9 domain family [Trichomonas vaginalis G3]EAY17375.1 hypothetical protein TVAG_319700 [Trichomonas vaginalis G3]KAI5491384.1 VPS9 domain family [Trichomonas vaginalis G3]|eukprot:XP_001330744.1 hypothetical protein [Trichomonas vaginalis G3]
MYNLFSGNVIPSSKILRLKDNFFKITFPDSIAHEEKTLKYFQAYTKRLAAQIAQFQEPVWKNSFHSFLIDLIKQGKSRLDQELMYFRELEDEISFSRALFNPQSIYQSKIDELFKSDLKTENTNEFVLEIMDFCDDFVPEDELDSDEQTCCILILVRAIFNRFYERCEKLFAPKYDSDYQKIEDLKQIPVLLFTIPTELVQLPITGSISSYFRSDPFFLAAAQFLSQTIFQSNPIDSLYYIHKCLIGIQKGALIRRLGGVDAKLEDVRSLLCFDDLFSLLFGILMASDIPDIYFVADFISRYAPKNSLSPAFEYATANIEALIEHVRRVDLAELKEKAK